MQWVVLGGVVFCFGGVEGVGVVLAISSVRGAD